jgi:hypothetical protein
MIEKLLSSTAPGFKVLTVKPRKVEFDHFGLKPISEPRSILVRVFPATEIMVSVTGMSPIILSAVP